MKITKSGILTFLGILFTTLIGTLLTRVQSKNDMQQAVHDILEEERRQISEAAVEKDQEDV